MDHSMTCKSVVCKLHFLVCELCQNDVIISKHASTDNVAARKHLTKL